MFGDKVSYLITIWLVAIGIASAVLWHYSATPGSQGSQFAYWPLASSLKKSAVGYTLVVFLHPQCPCSRATLAELERIQSAIHPTTLATQFVFSQALEDQENSSDLKQRAKRLPGATVTFDRDGTEIARFGVLTSGHTLLYDANGALAFSGGITTARGHEGQSVGRDAIIAKVRGMHSQTDSTAVFGCHLESPSTSKIPS